MVKHQNAIGKLSRKSFSDEHDIAFWLSTCLVRVLINVSQGKKWFDDKECHDDRKYFKIAVAIEDNENN